MLPISSIKNINCAGLKRLFFFLSILYHDLVCSSSKGSDLYFQISPSSAHILVTTLMLSFRTETVVEKLLTNWMSICLYAFVRVSSLSCDAEGPKEGKHAQLYFVPHL